MIEYKKTHKCTHHTMGQYWDGDKFMDFVCNRPAKASYELNGKTIYVCGIHRIQFNRKQIKYRKQPLALNLAEQ